jgi:curved DNA-binding protein CbpA
MQHDTDHYAALGILPTADSEVIAAAYRALVKKFHPDTGAQKGTASAERFRAVQEAYELLSDPKRRRDYDEARTQRLPPPEPEAAPAPSAEPAKPRRARPVEAVQLPPAAAVPPDWRRPPARPRNIGFVALIAVLMLAVAAGAFLLTLPEAEPPSSSAPTASVTPEAEPSAQVAQPEAPPPADAAQPAPEPPAEQASIPQEPSPQIGEPDAAPQQSPADNAAPQDEPPPRYVLSMYEKAGNVTTTLANGSLSFNSRRACEDFALQARERRLDAIMVETGTRPEVWFECRGVTATE